MKEKTEKTKKDKREELSHLSEKALLNIGAAYIRVSDERQDEYSPDSQLKKIRESAARDGYYIPDEYVFYDDGISGKSTKKRDDFNRMIAIAKEKTRPFDRIYVWKFSRFARNQEESLVYKNLLLKRGVSVVSVSQSIPEGPFGSLIERIIEWMDEFYLINLGEEVTRGMTEKATRGEPTCAPPYGYMMKEGKYYPDEESGAADIVREVFASYASGKKIREIAVSLGERGIRSKFGNMPDNRWIEYMLRNPCYIGKIRWSLEGARAVSKRDFDNANIMTVDGKHEPIIAMEIWDEVQKKLDYQKKAYPKYARREQNIDYMMKGLLRCHACGGSIGMAAAKSGRDKTPTLQCFNYSRGTCHISHSVTMPRIEAALLVSLKAHVQNGDFAILPKSIKKSAEAPVDYEKLLAAEERRLARAKEAYLAEIDTLEQYGKNKNEILNRIKTLKERMSEQIEATIDRAAFSQKVADVIALIEREEVEPSAKNEALRTVIEKIVYDKTTERLKVYFHEL